MHLESKHSESKCRSLKWFVGGVPSTMGLSWYSPGLAREIFLIWQVDPISDPYPPDICWKKWWSLKLYVSWGSCRLSVSNRCFFQLTGFHFHTIVHLESKHSESKHSESKCRSLQWFVGGVPNTMGTNRTGSWKMTLATCKWQAFHQKNGLQTKPKVRYIYI